MASKKHSRRCMSIKRKRVRRNKASPKNYEVDNFIKIFTDEILDKIQPPKKCTIVINGEKIDCEYEFCIEEIAIPQNILSKLTVLEKKKGEKE